MANEGIIADICRNTLQMPQLCCGKRTPVFLGDIPLRLLPIPPAPTLLDEFLIDIPIGQQPVAER